MQGGGLADQQASHTEGRAAPEDGGLTAQAVNGRTAQQTTGQGCQGEEGADPGGFGVRDRQAGDGGQGRVGHSDGH